MGVSNSWERKQEFIALEFSLLDLAPHVHVTVYYCLLIKIPAVNRKLWMFSGMTELTIPGPF